MKIAVIGGGSVYTPELIRGLIGRRDRLPLVEVALVDLPAAEERLGVMADFARRMFRAAGWDVSVRATTDRREAVAGSAFVLNQFRVGGEAARRQDERIPTRYGIPGQETVGPGGFALALRTVPVALAVAEEVRELAPRAWVINFANPAGLVTEAMLRHAPGVRSVGLCNIPLVVQGAVAKALGVPLEAVTVRAIGLNHLSFFRVAVRGEDVTRDLLATDLAAREFVANVPGLDPADPAAQALFVLARRWGAIPNPYLRYYLFPRQVWAEIHRRLEEGRGTRADEVIEVNRALLDRYREPQRVEPPPELARRGGALYSEAAVRLIDALCNGGGAPQVVNVPNRGATPDLPDDAVIEVDAVVAGGDIRPVVHGPLPAGLRGLVQAVKAYEELTITAAVTGDRTAALEALAAHPLVPDLTTAVALLDELLKAHAPHIHPALQRGGTAP